MNSDCVFCKIVSRAIPAPLLYEDEQVVAFRDISPQAPAHLLVIPKQHFVDLPSLIAAGQEALAGRLLKVATQVAKEQGLVESGFRTVINTGEHGGQSVFHLHVHVLGGRHLAWPPG